jgi:hypothetical protein
MIFCAAIMTLCSTAVQAATTKAGGTLAADETWTAAGSPYTVTGSLTVPAGRTLTIEPDVDVYLASGVSLTVANGGRILAEGTAAQAIRFTRPPGTSASWGGLTINGAGGSPETRLAYVDFDGNGKTCIAVAAGTLYLDHATFSTTTQQYLSLKGASFVVSHCHFPTPTASLEPVKGSGGIQAGGHGILRHCFLGKTTGHNDALGFSGGQRGQNQPILQVYHNVFIGSGDDLMDIDGTDAWIEGNIFLHCHRKGSPDSSAAVSAGSDSGQTAEVTILGNLIFDCDDAATAKQGNFYTLINNTIVHTTRQGGEDSGSGVVCVRDTTPSLSAFAKGFYLEGNIIVEAEQLARNYDAQQTTVTFINNILPLPWTGPGSDNVVLDPLLKHIPEVSETDFKTWDEAQVMWEWFSLQPGSPARGTGPNGLDKGGVVPRGVSISGVPRDVTSLTNATLVVGVNRTGYGIPTAGFPLGSGFTHYRWRLDDSAWSAETPIAIPITLTGLPAGAHHVDVVGKNDAGWYQNDPALGDDAVVTASRTWTVDPSYQRFVINEVLAVNQSAAEHEGTFPGLVELYYDGATALDLSGMSLTNDATQPAKFVFPAGAQIAPGQYLVLYADSGATTSGLHLGFTLKAGGDRLFLCDRLERLLDSVQFGLQLTDCSIGRVGGDDTWRLTFPTFGQDNVAQPLGDSGNVKINEWLAAAQITAAGSFVELYNPASSPVDLSGMCLTDGAAALPAARWIGPLSFLAGREYLVFQADGSGQPWHTGFRLSPTGGMIRLFDAQAEEIDSVTYGVQAADVSQGRTPDGASRIDFFTPTPGTANPSGPKLVTTTLTLVAEAADKRLLVPTGPISDDWKGGGAPFDDSAWLACTGAPGGVGYERSSGYDSLITLDLESRMYGSGKNCTCYIRIPFPVDARTLADVNNLTLQVRYDDGFVAYLNGKEIARRNFTGTPAWDSEADSAIESAAPALDESIDVTAFLGDLKAGANVLAIQGMNAGSTSSDLLITAALEAVLVKMEEQ